MAVDPKSSVEDYWSNNIALRNDYITRIMSRKRFSIIQRYFHVNDPMKDPSRLPDAEARHEALKKESTVQGGTSNGACQRNELGSVQ